MSDGSLHKSSKNACIVVEMTNKEYLEYLSNKFPYLSTSVSLKHTSEESARHARESGFRENAKAENYQNTYLWNTRRHPFLNKFRTWYESGNKVWPHDIELTPRVLKHLYVGDGNLEKRKGLRLSIAMNNERNNKEKIKNYFKRANLPPPEYWGENDAGGVERCKARWYTESSKELLEYMGSAPPGFEYKWP